MLRHFLLPWVSAIGLSELEWLLLLKEQDYDATADNTLPDGAPARQRLPHSQQNPSGAIAMSQQRRYQFKHIKLGSDLADNDRILADEAAAGWEVVTMAIDRRVATASTAPQEQLEVIYLLRKPQ